MKKIYILLFLPLLTLSFSCSSVQTQTSLKQSPKKTQNVSIKFSEKNHEKEVIISTSDFYKFKDKKVVSDKKTHINQDVLIQSMLDDALEECQGSQGYWQEGDFENALLSLDNAYSLLLQTNITDSPELMQQREDIRFTISKRILEIYASRNVAVNGYHKEIPVILNKHVKKEIKYLTKTQRTFFIEALKRSGIYRPAILKELKAAGLPLEISWLPLVESGFKVRAFSKARALGLWQFIASTGYKFGLSRDVFIDERLDPAKSTKAAIAYLKALHNIFGDWATALAAYNCGERRVLREMRKQNINYLDNFWDIYSKLPKETARYYPRFLATIHIVNNLKNYGFDIIELEKPAESIAVTINRQVSLIDISKKINVEPNVMVKLNPSLRHKLLPNREFSLNIPKDKKDILLSSINGIAISLPPQPAFVKYRVRYGDSLSVIAKRFKTSVKKIVRTNRINKKNYIVAGKILKIPQKKCYLCKN